MCAQHCFPQIKRRHHRCFGSICIQSACISLYRASPSPVTSCCCCCCCASARPTVRMFCCPHGTSTQGLRILNLGFVLSSCSCRYLQNCHVTPFDFTKRSLSEIWHVPDTADAPAGRYVKSVSLFSCGVEK